MATTRATAVKRKADEALDKEAKKFKSTYSKALKIVVYQAFQRQTFAVHEDLLYHYAPNLKHFSYHSSVPAAADIKIEKHLPTTFRNYLEWLYSSDEDRSRCIRTLLQPTIDGAGEKETRDQLACVKLIRLWLLTNMLGDKACKNAVIDVLISRACAGELCLCASSMVFIFEETDETSELRRWAVDEYTASTTVAELDDGKDMMPEGFEGSALRRLIEKTRKGERVGKPRLEDACLYHDHGRYEARCS
ncbi:uncharacterized protein LTR77_010764 [Saxophila tyrrhenica]|uniref:BTB domain-containing protein n=1 Tax=Saxophila tyrrhenica TaxID=1690608 RepID=A0AAV9NX90_9PEZI|nr:hypothetical protein LTR77_010764 [Saxophila tyrrhenica]